MTPNIADIIRRHVSFEVRCIDRLYLHAYMPKLQTSGGLCYFLHDHLGHPIPSPTLFRPMHDRFVNAVDPFVGSPWINSTSKSINFTRRPPLWPEKLASNRNDVTLKRCLGIRRIVGVATAQNRG